MKYTKLKDWIDKTMKQRRIFFILTFLLFGLLFLTNATTGIFTEFIQLVFDFIRLRLNILISNFSFDWFITVIFFIIACLLIWKDKSMKLILLCINHLKSFIKKVILHRSKLITLISVFESIATVVSVFLILSTLQEMQIDRDNAYRPFIVIENTIIEIGEIRETNTPFTTNADSISSEKPLVKNIGNYKDDFDKQYAVKAKCLNIGVGTAKNVRFIIDHDTVINKWTSILNSGIAYYSKKTYEVRRYKSIFFIWEYEWENKKPNSYKTSEMIFSDTRNGAPDNFQLFMLPNAEGETTFVLPGYVCTLLNLLYSADMSREPLLDNPLSIVIEFEDVQGKKYTNKYVVSFEEYDYPRTDNFNYKYSNYYNMKFILLN